MADTIIALPSEKKTAIHKMTRKGLLRLLTEEAKKYRREAFLSIERNQRMNDLSERDLAKLKEDLPWAQRVVDALLVDFINTVGVGQCIDYGLYVKHLKLNGGGRA